MAEAAEQLVTLVCPLGADQGKISHNDREFLPYREDHRDQRSRWLVDVPPEVAMHLCNGVAGFVPLDPTHPLRSRMLRQK